MSEFLHSPFAIGVCLVTLVAWVVMLCAIFWPGKDDKDGGNEPPIGF